MTQNFTTGVAFIAGGSVAGLSVCTTVGGMGLAGGFGAVGVGTTPVVAAGAVAGAATYGVFKAITEVDATAVGAVGIGAIGGVACSAVFGSFGLVAPKIGLAFGIGTVPMAGVGAVVGLAAYGVAKLLDESEVKETPAQVFERMEEKVLQMDFYSAAVEELELFLTGEDLNRKFTVLEVEDELQALKAELKNKVAKESSTTIEPEIVSPIPQSSLTWKSLHTLKGHLAAVNAIAITPDSDTLVSGSDDRQVNLWSLKTGQWLYSFTGQAEAVLSVAISPDGQQVASGSVDRKITSWQLNTRKFWRTFFYLNSPFSHDGFVNSLAFSPDGKYLASGGADNKIRIWGRYTGSLKRTLNGHTKAVLAVVFSPDGKVLVSSSADKTIRIWDFTTGKQHCILTEHLGSVNTFVITPDSQILISGSTDTTVKFWNLHSGKLLSTLSANSQAVSSLAISPDGKILAVCSKDGMIKLWNLHTREIIQTLVASSPVAFSPDGMTLVTGGNGGSLKIWTQTQNNMQSSGKWWQILGVDQNAHPRYVKLSYLRLARKYHPDVNSSENAKALMQLINQAYKHYQQQV
jgi:WD40 repeat protein